MLVVSTVSGLLTCLKNVFWFEPIALLEITEAKTETMLVSVFMDK